MSEFFRQSSRPPGRLDEAVRRATPGFRVALPGRRGLLRIVGAYANVFAVLVALGIPNGTLRQATVGALTSFDGVVRQASAEVVEAGSEEGNPHPASPEAPPVEPSAIASSESLETEPEAGADTSMSSPAGADAPEAGATSAAAPLSPGADAVTAD